MIKITTDSKIKAINNALKAKGLRPMLLLFEPESRIDELYKECIDSDEEQILADQVKDGLTLYQLDELRLLIKELVKDRQNTVAISAKQEIENIIPRSEWLKAELSKIETTYSAEPIENGFVLSDRKKEIVLRSVGTESDAGFKFEDRHKFDGNVITHNHPSGGSLSWKDTRTFVYYKPVEIRASYVCNARKGVYILRHTNKIDIPALIMDFGASELNSVVNATAIVRNHCMTKNTFSSPKVWDAAINLVILMETEKWLIMNAFKYGFVYVMEDL